MTFKQFKNHARGLRLSDFYLLILYSQAQLESGKNLDSGLAKNYNNLFGMQKPSIRDTVNSGSVSLADNQIGDQRDFLTYENVAQSIADRYLWDEHFTSNSGVEYEKASLWGSMVAGSSNVECDWVDFAYQDYMCKVCQVYSEANPETYYNSWFSLLQENYNKYIEENGERPNGYDPEEFGEDDQADLIDDKKGSSGGLLGLGNFLFKLPSIVVFLIILAFLWFIFIKKGKK